MRSNSFIGSVALAACAVSILACDSEKDSSQAAKAKSIAGDKAGAKAGKAGADKAASTKPSGPLKPAPTGSWTGHFKDKLQLSSAPGSEIWFYVSPSDRDAPWSLTISAKKLPAGTKIVVGGGEPMVIEKNRGYFHHDLSAVAGSLPLSSVYHKYSYKKKRAKVDVALQVHLPGHEPFVGKLPDLDPSRALARHLRTLDDEAIKFAGEPADDGERDTIATAPKYGQMYVFGKGKKIWDIDLVVVPSDVPTDRKINCRFTRGSATLTLEDAKVVLYDRRSGKVLKEDTIKHGGRCPFAVTIDKRKRTGKTGVGTKAIEKWARAALAKHKKS